MCCCCDCPLDLGCIDTCKCLDTGMIAESNGIYTLNYEFNGVTLKTETELVEGDTIVFDISELVGNYHYQAEIEDPLCRPVPIIKNTIEYDCIAFSTKLTINNAN